MISQCEILIEKIQNLQTGLLETGDDALMDKISYAGSMKSRLYKINYYFKSCATAQKACWDMAKVAGNNILLNPNIKK